MNAPLDRPVLGPAVSPQPPTGDPAPEHPGHGRLVHPDPQRWPDVAALPPASRARVAVARALLRRALDRLPLRVEFDRGHPLGRGGLLLRVHRPEAFFRRIGARGLIGFGESHMAGEWDAPDLPAVLTVLAAHATTLVPPRLQRLRRYWEVAQPGSARNTPGRSRTNISHHYDLSNALFALFLDETLSYSSAVFDAFPATPPVLAEAQRRKIDLLLDAADVGPGTRLLEIGTGWGELAIRAARRGARVTSLTLSREQRDLAEQRVREAGLADRVDIRLRDYREAEGTYEAIVSVEMIEAVGEEFWPRYFQVLQERLAPGGRIALQAITMPHDRLLVGRTTHTWIQKYVFPGGMLPSTEALRQVMADHTDLRIERRTSYGPHYAETLRLWRERFTGSTAQVSALGFDEVFQRLWTFYLAYSEAGFRSGYLDVQQFLLTAKEPVR